MKLSIMNLLIPIGTLLLFCLTINNNGVYCSDEAEEVSIEHRSSPDHKELLVMKQDTKTCSKSSSLACAACCVGKGFSKNANSFKGTSGCVCDIYTRV